MYTFEGGDRYAMSPPISDGAWLTNHLPGETHRIILLYDTLAVLYRLVLFGSLGSCLQSGENLLLWGGEPGVNGSLVFTTKCICASEY
jgi:hypothetical protein